MEAAVGLSPFSGVRLQRMDRSPRHQQVLPTQRDLPAFVHRSRADDNQSRKLRPLSTLLKTSAFTTTDYGWLDECRLASSPQSQSACDLRSPSLVWKDPRTQPAPFDDDLATIPEIVELVDATREIENMCDYFGHPLADAKNSLNPRNNPANVQSLECEKENYGHVTAKSKTRLVRSKSRGDDGTDAATTSKCRETAPRAMSAQSSNVIQPAAMENKVTAAFQRSVANRRSFSLPRLRKFAFKVNQAHCGLFGVRNYLVCFAFGCIISLFHAPQSGARMSSMTST